MSSYFLWSVSLLRAFCTSDLHWSLWEVLHHFAINLLIGKGIEPHPTDGHTQNNLSIDTWGGDAFTSSVSETCRSSGTGFAISLHSLLILYQIYSVMSSFFSFFLSFLSFSWKNFHCGLRDSSHSRFGSFMMILSSLICGMHMTTWPTQAVSLVLSC